MKATTPRLGLWVRTNRPRPVPCCKHSVNLRLESFWSLACIHQLAPLDSTQGNKWCYFQNSSSTQPDQGRLMGCDPHRAPAPPSPHQAPQQLFLPHHHAASTEGPNTLPSLLRDSIFQQQTGPEGSHAGEIPQNSSGIFPRLDSFPRRQHLALPKRNGSAWAAGGAPSLSCLRDRQGAEGQPRSLPSQPARASRHHRCPLW